MPIKRKFRSDSQEEKEEEEKIEEEKIEEASQPARPKLREEDYGRLLRKAADDTLSMCRRSEDDYLRRRVPLIEQQIAKNPEMPLISKSFAHYYFRRAWFDISLFACLHVNCKENGELISPYAYDPADWDFDPEWGLEKSQEYTKLFDEIHTCFKKQEWDLCWTEKFNCCQLLANKMNLNQLDDADIKECLTDAVVSRTRLQILQELKFYHFLYESSKDITDEEKFWEEVQKSFPLVDREKFERGMDLFYPHGKKLSSEKLRIAWMPIEEEYELGPKSFANMVIISTAEYYKLKHKKALELGLIKLNKEGVYVDNYDVSTWKMPT